MHDTQRRGGARRRPWAVDCALVAGWATPLKNMIKSVGMIIYSQHFPTEWKKTGLINKPPGLINR